jgi:biopolymer transport protein ExbD
MENPMCTNGQNVSERPNSVEVSVNAKGEVSYKVKCYSDTAEDASVEAVKQVKELEDKLPKKFER